MLKKIAEIIERKHPSSKPQVVETEVGDSVLLIEAAVLLPVCQTLRDDESCRFNVLQVISGIDRVEHLEVAYILASFIHNTELILKVKLPRPILPELPEVDSVTGLWKAADFQERECYDMMGIRFRGHPDLRRILCPYEEWEGYPLRKDYQVQEKYLDMEVNPPEKMNAQDHYFYKKVQEECGENAKKVVYSWKD